MGELNIPPRAVDKARGTNASADHLPPSSAPVFVIPTAAESLSRRLRQEPSQGSANPGLADPTQPHLGGDGAGEGGDDAGGASTTVESIKNKPMHVQMSRARGEWYFPRGKGLLEKRVEVNGDGVERVMKAMREEALILEKPPPVLDRATFITWEEQCRICLFYETKIVAYCKVFRFDTDGAVQATAIAFFKRFYLVHTIMDHDPKLVLLTCLFLAAKVENSHMGLTEFLGKVPKAPPPEAIVELEFVLCTGLKFIFAVPHLKWPLHGLFLDMQAYLLAKHPNPKSPELRDDLAKLADTYASAIELGQHALHTDLLFTHWPSQIAMACFLVVARTFGFRDEVERYITYRLGKKVAGGGGEKRKEEPAAGGGFVKEEDEDGEDGEKETGEGGRESVVADLKIVLKEIEEVLVKAKAMVAAAAADKEEAKRIDVKLQACRNPEMIKDGPLYKRRRQQEEEEKEAKRQNKLKRMLDDDGDDDDDDDDGVVGGGENPAKRRRKEPENPFQ
ncbi:hypothetical protein HDU96_009058 [Phlyctochytrium bullatum]|nr:hypothetical protein HDU96_009058 [Phlyctochytrium bullatum]